MICSSSSNCTVIAMYADDIAPQKEHPSFSFSQPPLAVRGLLMIIRSNILIPFSLFGGRGRSRSATISLGSRPSRYAYSHHAAILRQEDSNLQRAASKAVVLPIGLYRNMFLFTVTAQAVIPRHITKPAVKVIS